MLRMDDFFPGDLAIMERRLASHHAGNGRLGPLLGLIVKIAAGNAFYESLLFLRIS